MNLDLDHDHGRDTIPSFAFLAQLLSLGVRISACYLPTYGGTSILDGKVKEGPLRCLGSMVRDGTWHPMVPRLGYYLIN